MQDTTHNNNDDGEDREMHAFSEYWNTPVRGDQESERNNGTNHFPLLPRDHMDDRQEENGDEESGSSSASTSPLPFTRNQYDFSVANIQDEGTQPNAQPPSYLLASPAQPPGTGQTQAVWLPEYCGPRVFHQPATPSFRPVAGCQATRGSISSHHNFEPFGNRYFAPMQGCTGFAFAHQGGGFPVQQAMMNVEPNSSPSPGSHPHSDKATSQAGSINNHSSSSSRESSTRVSYRNECSLQEAEQIMVKDHDVILKVKVTTTDGSEIYKDHTRAVFPRTDKFHVTSLKELQDRCYHARKHGEDPFVYSQSAKANWYVSLQDAQENPSWAAQPLATAQVWYYPKYSANGKTCTKERCVLASDECLRHDLDINGGRSPSFRALQNLRRDFSKYKKKVNQAASKRDEEQTQKPAETSPKKVETIQSIMPKHSVQPSNSSFQSMKDACHKFIESDRMEKLWHEITALENLIKTSATQSAGGSNEFQESLRKGLIAQMANDFGKALNEWTSGATIGSGSHDEVEQTKRTVAQLNNDNSTRSNKRARTTNQKHLDSNMHQVMKECHEFVYVIPPYYDRCKERSVVTSQPIDGVLQHLRTCFNKLHMEAQIDHSSATFGFVLRAMDQTELSLLIWYDSRSRSSVYLEVNTRQGGRADVQHNRNDYMHDLLEAIQSVH